MKKKNIMQLSEKECIEKLEEYLKNNCDSSDKVEKIIEHTKRVLKICKKIVKYYDDEVCKEKKKLIFRSAIFHDIAKIEFGEDHNKKVNEILKKIFVEDEDLEKICNIIKYHKGEFVPQDDIISAAVLRVADKIDKINKNKMDKFVDKYSSSIKKIRKSFEKIDVDYEKFKEACDMVKIETVIKKYIPFNIRL